MDLVAIAYTVGLWLQVEPWWALSTLAGGGALIVLGIRQKRRRAP